MTVDTLKSLRTDSAYDTFWNRVNHQVQNLDVDEPVLPRRRKMPKRFETGSAAPEFHMNPKDLYRQKYYEAFDIVINSISDRFDQDGYKIYRNIHDLLLKSIRGEEFENHLGIVTEFYHNDVDAMLLKSQLQTLHVQ